MNKLELHHICGYLPYGMRFVSEMDKPYDEYGKQPIWTCDGIVKLFGEHCLDTRENKDAYPISKVKLILRPLSDFNDEEQELFYKDNDTWNSSDRKTQAIREAKRTQWFLERHYDLFRLIDQNLAVNINTINP